ncbi:hypothetical protein B0H63DRAFT_99790 [Podospora didyma]|uniref:Syntaxin ufe1 n=1 Tax=Podospora didyma TaxID=330526 RepID=A0AAE0NY02_9PEZI|nr:hypothetical protein B0H63DRAFT_99790 [Podospora didyma]
MADLTKVFDGLLKGHEAAPTKRPSTETADEFLKQAYRISSLVAQLHADLRNLRQAYLSTAAPRKTHLRTTSRNGAPPAVSLTDRNREEIDADAKMTLRDLNARILALEYDEKRRQEIETELLQRKFARVSLRALLGTAAETEKSSERIAVEAVARQLGAHRESVVWFLRQRLQETARTQQRMMETRLQREIEKNRSVLAKARGPTAVLPPLGRDLTDSSVARSSTTVGNSSGRPGLPVEERERRPQHLDDITDEQRRVFEKGNQDMVKHFESTLDKVRTAEKSLVEISELQNLLVNNLVTQSAHIDQLVAESFETTEGVGKGNKELKKSAARASPARYTFFAAAGLCAVLVAWDLVI